MITLKFNILPNQHLTIEFSPKTIIFNIKKCIIEKCNIKTTASSIILLYKRVLKNSERLNSIKYIPGDFINVHIKETKPIPQYCNNVYSIISLKAQELIKKIPKNNIHRRFEYVSFPAEDNHKIDIEVIKIFKRTIEILPESLEYIIRVAELLNGSEQRTKIEDVIYNLGLDPTVLCVHAVKNNTAIPVDRQDLTAALEQACHDLKLDYSIYEEIFYPEGKEIPGTYSEYTVPGFCQRTDKTGNKPQKTKQIQEVLDEEVSQLPADQREILNNLAEEFHISVRNLIQWYNLFGNVEELRHFLIENPNLDDS